MKEYSLLIPVLPQTTNEYLLLDAILYSSCFADTGEIEVCGCRCHKYTMKIHPPIFMDGTPKREAKNKLILIPSTRDTIIESILSTYGLRLNTEHLLEIEVADLPIFAKTAKNGIRPSERMVAEEARRLWQSRGFAPGKDVEDWLRAEELLIQRLDETLKRLLKDS